MLLGKWKWRFLVEREALGRRVIREFFGVDGGFGPSSNIKGPHGIWCDIIKAVKNINDIDPSFNSSFCLKVSNGSNIRFWKDPYFSLSDGYVDKWIWSGDASGIFKVKSLSSRIERLLFSEDGLGFHHRCNSWISRKVNICVWRASIDRLATRSNLSARGVNLDSVLCPFCEGNIESISHYLLLCPRVKPIWRKIWSWWDLDLPLSFPAFSIENVNLCNMVDLGCSKLNKILHGVFHCCLWAVWK
ncbi:RNA-directed DNA polymerase, eukaryota, reverse transcriptase zinc-binding domain protein [Tanacetum coccineum]